FSHRVAMPPPLAPDVRQETETLLKRRIPIIVLETRDEPRALALIAGLGPRLAEPTHTPILQWTITEGLRRLDIDLGGAQRHHADPGDVLRSIRATDKAGVYVLLDFHPFIADPVHVRLLKDICQGHARTPRTLVLISHELALP